MNRITVLLVVILAIVTAAAVAQNPSGASSNPSSTQTSPPSSQSSSQTGAQTSSGSSNSSLDGCVVAVEKDFYLQPTDGSSPVKLTGAHDFSSDVGHHVSVKGTPSSASSSSGTSAGGTSSTSGGQGQAFMVTEVDTVAEACPSAGANPH